MDDPRASGAGEIAKGWAMGAPPSTTGQALPPGNPVWSVTADTGSLRSLHRVTSRAGPRVHRVTPRAPTPRGVLPSPTPTAGPHLIPLPENSLCFLFAVARHTSGSAPAPIHSASYLPSGFQARTLVRHLWTFTVGFQMEESSSESPSGR